MAAAAPFALKAGTMFAGSLLGKKLSGPSKAQSTAMTGTQNAAGALSAYAPQLMSGGSRLINAGLQQQQQGAGQLGQAGDYYSRILSGNRNAARSALAPETMTALEYYRGAGNKVQRTMRGGARDYAQAELDRQKVGQLASYLPAARANAAQGMERVGAATGNMGASNIYGGSSLVGQGTGAAQSAGYINSGLFNQASQLQEQQGAGGKAWGSFLYDLAQQLPWGKKGGPSTQVPNLFVGF